MGVNTTNNPVVPFSPPRIGWGSSTATLDRPGWRSVLDVARDAVEHGGCLPLAVVKATTGQSMGGGG